MGSRQWDFSSCGSQALGHRLSSCGTRALLLQSMWDPAGSVIDPVSPTLAGGFLSTATREVPGQFLDSHPVGAQDL